MLILGRWAKLIATLGGMALISGAVVGGCSIRGSELPEGDGEPSDGAGASDDSGPTSVGSGSSGSSDDDHCAEFDAEAQSTVMPADIILAIDQSGSMDEETDWVEQQLNTFAAQITSANIDVRVIVIAAKTGSNALCVPAPLGSGACPDDDNPPGLLHVDERIGSHDALEVILETYASWSAALRPEAAKHFVVISDDDAEDVLADGFMASVDALDATMFGAWTFHAIVADDGNCDPAADEGIEYKKLVQDTGGILGDLCLQNFQPVWDQLSTEVVDGSQLACNWTLPTPPDGQTLDPTKVNVELTTNSNTNALGYVDTAAACGSSTDAWHYDDAATPTEIVLCPATCTEAQSADDAAVAIQFGCATVEAPPQ